MTRNEIILGLVVLVLVVYSLVVALVVPRRNPNFPGKKLGLFLAVTAVLVAGTIAAVQVVGGEEAEEAEAAEIAEVAESEPSEEPGAEPEPPPPEGEGPPGDPVAGAVVWEEAGCGACHTLAAADSTGTIGPNLDETMPAFELAVERVTNGQGQMPSFAGQLTEQQINDVAAFVVASTSG